MRVLNAAQRRTADRRTIEGGVPSLVLMEQAGRRVVEAIDRAFPGIARVAVVGGRGNNGGDGWVVARLLHARGLSVEAVVLAPIDTVTGDARTVLELARRQGVAVVEVTSTVAWRRRAPAVLGTDVVVDAMVGSGLNKPLAGLLAAVVRDLGAARRPIVSVDIPSGVAADSPHPIGPHVQATLTVTFAAPAPAHVLRPAAAAAGRLEVVDIGIPASLVAELEGPRVHLITPDVIRRLVPVRRPDAHKGDFGRVLVVAGSAGKAGAAQLAGLGALRAGAGLVTVATAAGCVGALARVPEYMTIGLPERLGVVSGEGAEALDAEPFDVVAAGPGLGVGDGPRAIVDRLRARPVGPLVLDADAITVYAGAGAACPLRERRPHPIVITPHPGELARLTGTSVATVQHDRIAAARDVATAWTIYVVLKGAQTVIATPAGDVHINTTGNPGMATGGSGDVLTGVVAAWLGQVEDVGAALQLAVYFHGRAGDLAAAAMGETAVIASDIAAHLGRAVGEATGDRR